MAKTIHDLVQFEEINEYRMRVWVSAELALWTHNVLPYGTWRAPSHRNIPHVGFTNKRSGAWFRSVDGTLMFGLDTADRWIHIPDDLDNHIIRHYSMDQFRASLETIARKYLFQLAPHRTP